jgi:hypothetical protein
MTVKYIGPMNVPNYICAAADIAGGTLADGQPGRTIFVWDTGAWRIIKDDLSLGVYALPGVTVSGAGDASAANQTAVQAAAGADATKVVSVQGVSGGKALGTLDGGPLQTVTRTMLSSDDATATPLDLTAAPTAGLKAVAMDILVSSDTACEIHILTESGSDLCGGFVAANGTIPFTLRGYIKAATAAKKLQLTTSVQAKIRGICVWFVEV